MVSAARSIAIPAESETATRLREADDPPIVLVVNSARYRVVREEEAPADDDIWA